MSDVFEPRSGLRMIRRINGEAVDTTKLPASVTSRIEMIASLDKRYQELKALGDFTALFELAKEYDTMKMHTMAGRIRKEIGI